MNKIFFILMLFTIFLSASPDWGRNISNCEFGIFFLGLGFFISVPIFFITILFSNKKVNKFGNRLITFNFFAFLFCFGGNFLTKYIERESVKPSHYFDKSYKDSCIFDKKELYVSSEYGDIIDLDVDYSSNIVFTTNQKKIVFIRKSNNAIDGVIDAKDINFTMARGTMYSIDTLYKDKISNWDTKYPIIESINLKRGYKLQSVDELDNQNKSMLLDHFEISDIDKLDKNNATPLALMNKEANEVIL